MNISNKVPIFKKNLSEKRALKGVFNRFCNLHTETLKYYLFCLFHLDNWKNFFLLSNFSNNFFSILSKWHQILVIAVFLLQKRCFDAFHNLTSSQIKIERPQRFRIGVFGSLYCFFRHIFLTLAHLASKFSPVPILDFSVPKKKFE